MFVNKTDCNVPLSELPAFKKPAVLAYRGRDTVYCYRIADTQRPQLPPSIIGTGRLLQIAAQELADPDIGEVPMKHSVLGLCRGCLAGGEAAIGIDSILTLPVRDGLLSLRRPSLARRRLPH